MTLTTTSQQAGSQFYALPQTTTNKLAYSRKEAAYLLSIGLRSLDYLLSEGEIPARKIGARTLITHAELEKFLKRDHSTKHSVQ